MNFLFSQVTWVQALAGAMDQLLKAGLSSEAAEGSAAKARKLAISGSSQENKFQWCSGFVMIICLNFSIFLEISTKSHNTCD